MTRRGSDSLWLRLPSMPMVAAAALLACAPLAMIPVRSATRGNAPGELGLVVRRTIRSRGAFGALSLMLLVLAACATPTDSYVSTSTSRGPYIDATLVLPSGDWRFLFPQSAACAEMLLPEAPVSYLRRGHFGRVRGYDGALCDPVGIGTLQRWRRSRRPGEMRPSSPARFQIIHEDTAVLLLRGRFAVASRLGIPNTFDVVAMVANDEVCAAVARSGVATLVFWTSGSRVLQLGACPVLAVAMPPRPISEAGAEGTAL